jgi:hypothetical protein
MKKCSPLDGQNGQLVHWWVGAGFTLAQSGPNMLRLSFEGMVVDTICLCYFVIHVCACGFWHGFFVASILILILIFWFLMKPLIQS